MNFSGESEELWNTLYAPSPASAPLKLRLGHHAFERAVASSPEGAAMEELCRELCALREKTSSLTSIAVAEMTGVVRQETSSLRESIARDVPQMEALNAFEQRMSQQVGDLFRSVTDRVKAEDGAAEMARVESSVCTFITKEMRLVLQRMDELEEKRDLRGKATSKGKVAEADLAQAICDMPGLQASVIAEKNSAGRMGGDLLIRDAHGMRAVLEVKDKGKLTPDDEIKFKRDAELHEGPEQVFIFLPVNGFGSVKRFLDKPLVEMGADGKVLVWFGDGSTAFLQRLPFILADCAAILGSASHQDFDAGRTRSLECSVDSARSALTEQLKFVRAELSKNDKAREQLQDRAAGLTKAINSLVSAGDDKENKKPRIF